MGILLILSATVFPFVFNVIYFLIGFPSILSRWISWGAINLSFLILIVAGIPYWAKREIEMIGAAVIAAMTNLGIQFAVGVLFMLLNCLFVVPWQLVLVVHLLLMMGFIVYGLTMRAANVHTETSRMNAQASQKQIQRIADELRVIMDLVTDDRDRKTVERLYDAARTLHMDSSSARNELDNSILQSVAELRHAAETKSGEVEYIAHQVQSLLDQRNASVRRKQAFGG